MKKLLKSTATLTNLDPALGCPAGNSGWNGSGFKKKVDPVTWVFLISRWKANSLDLWLTSCIFNTWFVASKCVWVRAAQTRDQSSRASGTFHICLIQNVKICCFSTDQISHLWNKIQFSVLLCMVSMFHGYTVLPGKVSQQFGYWP